MAFLDILTYFLGAQKKRSSSLSSVCGRVTIEMLDTIHFTLKLLYNGC